VLDRSKKAAEGSSIPEKFLNETEIINSQMLEKKSI
jgi:hypothetical protein